MNRVALNKIACEGERFSILQQIMYTMLLTSDDGLNDLELDHDYHQEFINIPQDRKHPSF
jgi:hypothetical protein